MKSSYIQGDTIYLRRLAEEDVTEDYVNWMNDPDINQYLESRFYVHTIDSVKSYVRSLINNENYQFGIFLKDTDEHIGNIKIGNINSYHRFGDIGFIIGNKKYWGRGIATEAVRLVTDFAFKELKLHKLWGGLYAPNIGSLRTFQKNGYEQEGIKKSHYLFNGVFVDDIVFSKINPYE